MNKKYFAISLIAASVAMTACSDDDDPVVETEEPLAEYTPGVGNSSMDTIANSENHNTLQELIETAGLAQTLDDPTAQFTIFAPTDAAFTALEESDADAYAALAADTDALARVLKGHVLVGSVQSGAIADGVGAVAEGDDPYSIATLATAAPASSLAFTADEAGTGFLVTPTSGTAVPLSADIDLGVPTEVGAVTTGVVHSLDTVLTIAAADEVVAPTGPTGATGATGATGSTGNAGSGSSDFDNILATQTDAQFTKFAAGIAGNEFKVTETGEGLDPWTIFAPTDAALGTANYVLNDYVIVNAALTPQQLLEGVNLATNSGKALTFGGTVDNLTLNGSPVSVINTANSITYRLDGTID